MNTDSSKNKQLLKQYPFLVAILDERMEPYGEPKHDLVHNLTIKVERADGDLMYYQAENTGLGDTSCLFPVKSDRKGQIGRAGEYLFAVNSDNEIINRLNWPRNEKEKRKSHQIYGHHVLWRKHTESLYSDSLCDQTKYIVRVSVSAWYQDARNHDGLSMSFGKLIDRQINLTVFCKPKQGFSKLQEDSSVYENLYLKDRVLIDGVIRNDFDYITIGGMLNELANLFKDEVYHNGLKKMYEMFPTRGGSGTFGSVKLMASDYRIQLEDATSWISFRYHDRLRDMSVHGMGGTLPQLRNLVKTVVKKWNVHPDSRNAFQPSGNISVM